MSRLRLAAGTALTAVLALNTSKVSGPVIVFLQAHLTTTTHHSPFTTQTTYYFISISSSHPSCLSALLFAAVSFNTGSQTGQDSSPCSCRSLPSFNSLLSKRCFPASLGTLHPILSCPVLSCPVLLFCTQPSHHFFLERLVPSVPPPKPSLSSTTLHPFSLPDQIN